MQCGASILYVLSLAIHYYAATIITGDNGGELGVSYPVASHPCWCIRDKFCVMLCAQFKKQNYRNLSLYHVCDKI